MDETQNVKAVIVKNTIDLTSRKIVFLKFSNESFNKSIWWMP